MDHIGRTARGIVDRMEPTTASTPSPQDSRSRSSEPHLSREWGFPLRHALALQAAYARAQPHEQRDGSFFGFRDAAQRAKAEQALERLREPGSIIVVAGPRGTGKTQLVCWLAFRLRQHLAEHPEGQGRFRAHYAVWAELCDGEKAEAGTIRRLRTHRLLAIDEAGLLAGTGWDRTLAGLIDQRYRDMLRTMLVTNHAPGELSKALPASVLSRAAEVGCVVAWEGKSWRGQ